MLITWSVRVDSPGDSPYMDEEVFGAALRLFNKLGLMFLLVVDESGKKCAAQRRAYTRLLIKTAQNQPLSWTFLRRMPPKYPKSPPPASIAELEANGWWHLLRVDVQGGVWWGSEYLGGVWDSPERLGLR